MSDRLSGIYTITNIHNGRVYVGSAVCFRKRWKEHVRQLGLNQHHSSHLQNAWNSYGADAFLFEIVEVVSDAFWLLPREQAWINRLGSCDREFGYNVSPTAGNQMGLVHTPEARARMAASQRGRKHSEETKRKISESHIGIPKSEAHRAKLSAARTGRKLSPETIAKLCLFQRSSEASAEHLKKMQAINLGSTRTPETRAKMSASAREGWVKRKAGRNGEE